MKIAFLGDSFTLGYGLANREECYTTKVCKLLGAEEENFGIAGTLMADTIARAVVKKLQTLSLFEYC